MKINWTMTQPDDRFIPLIEKLEVLLKRQESFSKEITELREEINRLKFSAIEEGFGKPQPVLFEEPEIPDKVDNKRVDVPFYQPSDRPVAMASPPSSPRMKKSDLEKFIGENLINKIGIAITVIGVAIGTKYSIDHNLISPLTRIILGYLLGLGLLGIGLKLRKNYENYSSVLVSGAIAIFYFISFFAYSLYGLIPQLVAFSLMVIFTALTVMAAIKYDRQVIAHIGMVGAYAVPFLLSNDSGNVAVLFSYMAIINIGILLIAFRKYWKPIYYASFLISWLIFSSWYFEKFRTTEHFETALLFLSVFFIIFYTIFLAYKLVQKEKFDIGDVILLLANSFIFYGLGYSILKTNDSVEYLLGIFTFCNALVHLGVALVVYRQKLADKNLFYLVAGLVLLFITIAIPVQLDGNWVTLLWAGEAALLFWIGRTKNGQFYELISYALIALTFLSIIQDWSLYDSYLPAKPETRIIPLVNIHFFSSLFVITSLGFINILKRNPKYPAPILRSDDLNRIVYVLIPASLLIVIFGAFRIEIATYWNQLYADSLMVAKGHEPVIAENIQNFDLLKFKTIWIINFSLLMMSALSLLNIRKLKSYNLGIVNLGLNVFVIGVFLIQGLIVLSDLRETYISQTLAEYYHRGSFNIGIRHISFLFVGLTLFSIYTYSGQDFLRRISGDLRMGFDCLFHLAILWIASSELVTWMEILKFTQSYQLGLSILWGIYALIVIILGIWEKKKYLRIGAIALFGITLYKLFFYDISDLDTIAKNYRICITWSIVADYFISLQQI